MVPLKHLSNFWKTLKMVLINCEIIFILTWSKKFLVAGTVANQEPKFKITDAKLYVPVVTLSTLDNVELLKQIGSDIKRTINLNKYQSKISKQVQNRCLSFLIDPNFQGVNRLSVLSFEDGNKRNKRL